VPQGHAGGGEAAAAGDNGDSAGGRALIAQSGKRFRGVIIAALAAVVFLALAYAAAGEDPPAAAQPSSKFYLRPTATFFEHLYEGEFLEPSSVFYEPKAREVFVADTKNNLVGVLTPEGVPLFAFGSDEIREPTRIAVDGDGRIYVLDNDRSRIKVFSYRGKYLGPLELPSVGPKPSFGALTFDADGNLYVGENESCRVLVFAPDRKMRLRLGDCGTDKGQFQSITGIAVDKERIVVTDAQAVAVQIFNKRGDFVRGWGVHDLGVQNFSLPQSVALDSRGHIIVIDTLRHEIKFFDGEGVFLDRFGGLGWRLGQVAFPTGVAIDAADHLFVVEKGNSRVQVFQEVEGVLEASPGVGGGNDREGRAALVQRRAD
jgi:DNA-binding beta-propeller fold protein YncE